MTLKDHIAAALSQGAAHSILVRAEQANPDQPPTDQVDLFLSGVRALSPFLRREMSRSRDRLDRVLASDSDTKFEALFPYTVELLPIQEMKALLRQARLDVAMAVALADLSGVWTIHDVVRCLSDFADRCVQLAFRTAWHSMVDVRGVRFKGAQPGTESCGVAIIAMGKHGARELNYSSDIDLVAVYDPTRTGLEEGSRLDEKAVAVKTVQIMVDILSEQTADGFVFRTDLRLRPNPSATAVAVSLSTAERYYETYGQNWERAAYIKARAVAGDLSTAAQFLDTMNQFIWRRSLDFGAVADIYAVKEQIHAEHGNPDLKVRDGNIKLGPGGIREIEFFAQTQQLLLGGRDPDLRSSQTLEAITQLAAKKHVQPTVVETLSDAYVFLRNLEHRLQMLEDAQTQTVPDTDSGFNAVACLMGYKDEKVFEAETLNHLRHVHGIYADLFKQPEPKTPVPGSLVFTGVEDDPRTLETLTKLGFHQPGTVTQRIRRWHQGGLKATKSARARELLTNLVPHILSQLSQYDDPDTGFSALDAFLTALPGGFQVFSLFTAHPNVLDDVIVLCQSSPQLMRQLGSRPSLVEGLIEGVDISPVAFPKEEKGDTLEDRLDIVRRVVNEHRTRALAATILGRAQPAPISQALADVADEAVSDLINAVRKDQKLVGKDPKGDLAVLGFGRLGMRALTAFSDLDLVFVYQADDEIPETQTQFTRLIRRIVSALSVPTAEGELYEIDMKLRPSGGAGPTAVSVSAFEKYYQEKAWIWEEMALTKARPVYGTGGLEVKLSETIEKQIMRPRDRVEVATAVLQMRERLLQEKPSRNGYDVKRLPGGLTEIDFLTQGLTLIQASKIGRPLTHTAEALSYLHQNDVISAEHYRTLTKAYGMFESMIQYTRAAFGTVPPATMGRPHQLRCARLDPAWDEDRELEEQIQETANEVKSIFDRYIYI